MHKLSFLPMFGLLCLLAIQGCQPGVVRTALSGSVTLDDEPVQDGQIAFEPVESGKMEFAIITDGRYSLPNQYGLVPGEYIVRITGNRPTGKMAKEDAFLRAEEGVSMEIFEQYVPAKFNTASTIRIQVEPVGTMEQDFNLISE